MLGLLDAALADARKGVRLAPLRADAHLSLAIALLHDGDVRAARASLARAERLPLPPNLTHKASSAEWEASVLADLAQWRIALAAADSAAGGTGSGGDLAAALNHLQRAVELAPGSGTYRRLLDVARRRCHQLAA